MSNAPAGWYDQGDGTQRYWDGNAWTEHRAPSAGPPAAPPVAVPPPAYAASPAAAAPGGFAAPPAAAPYVKPRKRVWPWVLAIVGFVVIVVIALVAWGVMALVGAVTGPVDAVNKFEDSIEARDCAAMEKTVTSSLLDSTGWEDCEVFKADTAELSASSFDANSSSIENGVATVIAQIRYPGDTTEYVGTYTLIKEGGDWRIDAFSVDQGGF